jgi:hypothetical protein
MIPKPEKTASDKIMLNKLVRDLHVTGDIMTLQLSTARRNGT